MLAERITGSVVQRQVKHVTPVAVGAARGLVAQVYRQTADEFRIVIPPVLLHSPAPATLAAYWMLMREPLIAAGAVGRGAKEAVAAAVSVANICPYCADMHSTGLYELAGEHDAEAIAQDRAVAVADENTRALAVWARHAHLPDDPAAASAPFTEAERPELVGVVVAFHYLSRMVNVFLASFLLPPRLGPSARRRFKRGLSRVLAPTLHADWPPGRALNLLPEAGLPAEASWAAASPTVAAAAARSYAAFAAAGERVVPPAVRELVEGRLARWRGEETGLGRDWCERLIAGLPQRQQAAGRLALLTALASYQVDEHVIGAFRREQPDDAALVDTVAWASWQAARRVGMWHPAAAEAHGQRRAGECPRPRI